MHWFKLGRKRNKLFWELAWEEYSWIGEYSEKWEILDRAAEYINEAIGIEFLDKVYAELYLTFDIFGEWEVNETTMDKFIMKNLPPVEVKMFKRLYWQIQNLLKKTGVDSQLKALQTRMNYIRSAFKQIVFDREITKRSLLLKLKQLDHQLLKYLFPFLIFCLQPLGQQDQQPFQAE